MSIQTFIISIYCLVDDLYNHLVVVPLRKAGPNPKLSDVELLSMEIIGEWMGHHDDKAIWQIKIMMQQRVMKELGANTGDLHFFDGFPAKVCVIIAKSNLRVINLITTVIVTTRF